MYAAGMQGMHQTVRSAASLGVIDDARATALKQLAGSERVTKQAMSGVAQKLSNNASKGASEQSFAAHLLSTDDQNAQMRRVFETGQPIIYAVVVNGSVSDISKIRGDNRVAAAKYGTLLSNGHVATPEPEIPSDSISTFVNSWRGKSSAALIAELKKRQR